MKFLISILFLFTTLYASAQSENIDSTKTAQPDITRQASFPGGDLAWRTFVTKMLERNIDVLVRDGQSGVCRLRFIVYEDGTIGDISALTMQNSELAKRSIKAISKGPKWIPALLHGKPVKAYREVPITFTLSSQ